MRRCNLPNQSVQRMPLRAIADFNRSAKKMKPRRASKGAVTEQIEFLTKKVVLLKKRGCRSTKAYFAICSPTHEHKQYYCKIRMPSGSTMRLAGTEPLQAVLNSVRFIALDLSRLESQGWRIYSSDGERKLHWRDYFEVAALKKVQKKRQPNKTPLTTTGSSAPSRV